ncbi:hypothetical protein BGZ58_009740 [Dissophora ornata]|nr:hypothetical protein BGZ58_009740 [Dissophora ornata]
MKSTTLLAFFMATMVCGASASATEIEKRTAAPVLPSAAFDATVNFLFKEQSSIVVKAFADACSDADISSALSTGLQVQVTGLISVDFGLATKLSGALKTSIKAAVQGEVSADTKSEFTSTLKVDIGNIITKRCPKQDAACIKIQAKNIASDCSKFTVKAAGKINDKIQANMSAKIQSAIDLQVKNFTINLLLVKITVSGDVDVSNKISGKFKAAAGLCAAACVDIQAKEASQIKTICSA